MTQSIIIFVIIAIVQVIAAGIAKKKEAEKKAELQNQMLGRKSNAPATSSVARPAVRANVQPSTPKRDLFAAAQEKAQRRSDASIPRGTAKPSTAGGESFTSVVGSRKELEKVADLGPNSKRVVFSDASRVHSNPLHMTLHTSDGEATSAQLAKTVSAIHEGMLRKNDLQGKVVKKVQPAAVLGAPQFSAMLRNPSKLRQAIVLSEILSAPVSLRLG
jgi:metal-dependent amidase/aminoacylase/carboxypeptidase family protein